MSLIKLVKAGFFFWKAIIDLGATIDNAIVTDVQNKKAYFQMYGIFNTSEYFEKSLKQGSRKLLKRLQDIVSEIEDQGVEYIGLGQYTSIVGWNGLGIKTKANTKMTTGNSLTVATTLMSVSQIVNSQGRSLADLTVGVVGVTGNICSVISEILTEKVKTLKLFYRESSPNTDKFKRVFSYLNATTQDLPLNQRAIVLATSDLNQLKDCDIIIVGTNSTNPIIFSEHLKPRAIVVDISVPANVDLSVLRERQDVICFSGGLVKLPRGQQVIQWLTGLPDSEVYACLAETLMMALLKVDTPYSYGPLTRASVERVTVDFAKVGFELGQRTYISSNFK